MLKTPDVEIYNIAQSMSNAHTIKAHRVQPFNKNCHKTVYAEMMIYSVGSLHHIKCALWPESGACKNNPYTLRIMLSIDAVFYIFKISHKNIVDSG